MFGTINRVNELQYVPDIPEHSVFVPHTQQV